MKNVKDVYACGVCGACMVTLQRDEGIALSSINCRRPGHCKGQMVALGGDIPQRIHADFCWVRPTKGELAQLRRAHNKSALAYHAQGGLLLKSWPRPWSEGGQKAFSRDWAELMKIVQDRTKKPEPAPPVEPAKEAATS